MKRVSVMITSYNQERYIIQALKSVLIQDYPNLEILIGDDASTDKTEEIIKPYLKDRRIKYVRHEKNIGQTANKHKLLYEHANGSYMMQLDGDDFLTDNTYISQAMKLAEKNDLSAIFAKNRVLIEKNKIYIEDKINSDLPCVIDGNRLFINYYKGYSLPSPGFIYDRSKALSAGFFEKGDIPSYDWESFLKLFINNKVGFINKYVSVWRKHTANVTKNADLDDFGKTILYIESLFDYACKKSYFHKNALGLWRKRMLKRVFFRLYVTFSILEQPERIKELILYVKNNYRHLYHEILLDPRLLLFRLLSVDEKMIYWAFKNILKQESFFVDLMADNNNLKYPKIAK